MVFLITAASLRHCSGWHLTVRSHSALLADSCQLTANSLQLTADSFYLLTIFLTTVIDPSRSLRITPFIPCHYDAFRSPLLVTCFPKIVILNGCKNAVWESREAAIWHRVKNLLFWWRLTGFPITAVDSSLRSEWRLMVFLTMGTDTSHSLRMTPCLLSGGKNAV